MLTILERPQYLWPWTTKLEWVLQYMYNEHESIFTYTYCKSSFISKVLFFTIINEYRQTWNQEIHNFFFTPLRQRSTIGYKTPGGEFKFLQVSKGSLFPKIYWSQNISWFTVFFQYVLVVVKHFQCSNVFVLSGLNPELTSLRN